MSCPSKGWGRVDGPPSHYRAEMGHHLGPAVTSSNLMRPWHRAHLIALSAESANGEMWPCQGMVGN
jgi:hypothetical protein